MAGKMGSFKRKIESCLADYLETDRAKQYIKEKNYDALSDDLVESVFVKINNKSAQGLKPLFKGEFLVILKKNFEEKINSEENVVLE